MTKAHARRPRRSSPQPLIGRTFLASLAGGGSLFGWVMLAQQSLQSAPPAIAASSIDVSTSATGATTLDLGPIPTVIPAPVAIRSQTQPSLLKPIPAISQSVVSSPPLRTHSSR